MKSADIVRVEIPGRERLFQLRWKVTSLCNYRCDFCIQGDPQTHRAQARRESRLCPHDHCSCNSFRLIERRSSPAP